RLRRAPHPRRRGRDLRLPRRPAHDGRDDRAAPGRRPARRVRAPDGRARRCRRARRRAVAARAAGRRRALSARATFDQEPERYDGARPGYPDAVFDDLASLAALGPGSRVLELGPGTGQATVALARRGYAVVAVELGAGLAVVAARRLAGFDAVEVVNAAFEDW